MSGHHRNEERSLALHQAVAEKLLDEPAVLARARHKVESWHQDGSVHPHYAAAWRRLLALTPEEIARRLVDRNQEMTDLRQSSPFADALSPRERWAILRRLPIVETR